MAVETPTRCSQASEANMGIDVASTFKDLLKSDPGLATAIAAIQTLILVLEKCPAGTLQELIKLLREAEQTMKTRVDCSVSSVTSGCALFRQFITLQSSKLEEGTFEEMRSVMLTKGNHFLEKMSSARGKVAKLAAQHISDCSKLLLHSKSRMVLAMLKEAATNLNKRFQVYVTETSFDKSGHDMVRDLEAIGIPCTLVLDSSVGYIMSQIDYVLVGAEGVVESGGIINKLGTYTMALCAKELNKPVYVLCESFKFVRLYPLNQHDMPDEFKFYASTLAKERELDKVHPLVDYTPPAYLTLLFTDLGVLTPSAVSDELIKLYS